MITETWEEISPVDNHVLVYNIDFKHLLDIDTYDQFKVEISSLVVEDESAILYAKLGHAGEFSETDKYYSFYSTYTDFAKGGSPKSYNHLDKTYINISGTHITKILPPIDGLTVIISAPPTVMGATVRTDGIIWNSDHSPTAVSGYAIVRHLINIDSLRLYAEGECRFTAITRLWGRVKTWDTLEKVVITEIGN